MRYMKLFVVVPLSVVLVLGWNLSQASASVPGVNEIVDVTSSGVIGNSSPGAGQMSHDGRYVAFLSYASNLIPNDTNNTGDVFVRDRTANTISRVNVSSSGTQANSYTQGFVSISNDGRYVAFSSNADNLVSGDSNYSMDVFLHDRQTATTQLISRSSSGTVGTSHSQEPMISGDGKFVVFNSSSTNFVSPATSWGMSNIFVKNIATGSIQLISKNVSGTYANDHSFAPSISCDGGVVVFGSSATNLIGSDTNGQVDVFVVSRPGGDAIMNVTPTGDNGSSNPRVSCDGMHVTFTSFATNFVSNDTNGVSDVFKYDRRTGVTSVVSVDSNGVLGNGNSAPSAISADGRLIAYDSGSTNLVSSDTNGVNDVFMRDTKTNTTYRVSVNASGQQGALQSYLGDNSGFSGDGKYLYFVSEANNLVSTDTNNSANAFIAETGL